MSTKLVYGETMAVQGDFLPHSHNAHQHSFKLKILQVHSLAPIPTSQHYVQTSSVPQELIGSQYVFARRDSHCPSSTPL